MSSAKIFRSLRKKKEGNGGKIRATEADEGKNQSRLEDGVILFLVFLGGMIYGAAKARRNQDTIIIVEPGGRRVPMSGLSNM